MPGSKGAGGIDRLRSSGHVESLHSPGRLLTPEVRLSILPSGASTQIVGHASHFKARVADLARARLGRQIRYGHVMVIVRQGDESERAPTTGGACSLPCRAMAGAGRLA